MEILSTKDVSNHPSIPLSGLGNTNPVSSVLSSEAKVGTKATPIESVVAARSSWLPPNILNEYHAGKRKLRKMSLFSLKELKADKVIKVFGEEDVKVDFLRNITRGQIDAGQVFLLTAFRVTVATKVDKDKKLEGLLNVLDFKGENIPTTMLNGELSLKIGDITFIERLPMCGFRKQKTENQLDGVYELETPRFIGQDTKISWEINMPDTLGIKNPHATESRVFAKFEMLGGLIK